MRTNLVARKQCTNSPPIVLDVAKEERERPQAAPTIARRAYLIHDFEVDAARYALILLVGGVVGDDERQYILARCYFRQS